MKLPARALIALCLYCFGILFVQKVSGQSPSAVTITIDSKDTRQRIDGFGVSGAFHMAARLMEFPEPQRTQILDKIFSPKTGAGFSILRNIIGDSGKWSQYATTTSIEPEEGTWNWTGDEDQIWLMNEASKRGCSRFVSTVWSPPAWMKTTEDVVGGELSKEKYQAFADYLSRYVREYKTRFGIDIYAVSPANEPDWKVRYSSCDWTGFDLHDFLKANLIPTFKKDGVTAKIILGEHSLWSEEPVVSSLNDPMVEPHVDIVAAHAYGGDKPTSPPFLHSGRTGKFEKSIASGKTIWQTEVSSGAKNDTTLLNGLYWAKLLHLHLVEDQVSAWFFWWAVNTKDSQSALIQLNPADKTWIAAKRLYTLSNFARFVRPGYVRLETDSTNDSSLSVSAFKSEHSDSLVLVVINENGNSKQISFSLKGVKGGKEAFPYRTSSDENVASIETIRIRKRKFATTLRGRSITTFVIPASGMR